MFRTERHRGGIALAMACAVLVLAATAGCGPKTRSLSKKVVVAEGAPPAPNSGIIRTPFGAVVVDGQPGYRPSLSLRKSAEKETGWEVSYLLLTSHHADHTLGNEVFSKAEIISTAAARRAFLEKVAAERDMLAGKMGIGGLKSAQLLPPTMTFEKSLTLYAGWPAGKTVEIRLIEMPAGAAPGNMVVYLPAEKILFAGDLAVNACFPYMGDADVEAWVRALDELDRLDCEQVVPGHGAAGDRTVLWQTRKFLADLCAAVKAAKASGRTLAEAGRDFAMPGYARWPGYRELLGVALERLWEQPLPEISLPPESKAAPAAPAPAEDAVPAATH